MARKAGSRNTGFYFRSGRGWCIASGKSSVLLLDDHGQPFRNRKVDKATMLQIKIAAEHQRPITVTVSSGIDSITITELCLAYFNSIRDTVKPATFEHYSGYLFD